jgi:long-subunit acyl-CoA synthetase (AMP-forming)
MAQINDRSRFEALQRLNQTLLQIDPYILPPYPNLSLVSGPLDPPLSQSTLSQLLYQQVELYPNNEAVIIPWTGARWTYQKLWTESNLLARSLLKYGVRPRDRVGIMSGNCERYIALFFACARVGAICVTLNNTYTATEMEYALKHTSKSDFTCKGHILTMYRMPSPVHHTNNSTLRQWPTSRPATR